MGMIRCFPNLIPIAAALLLVAPSLAFASETKVAENTNGRALMANSEGKQHGADAGESVTHLHLSAKEAEEIGRKVWRNECGGRIDGLTSWNAGEDFPSLGIGHFIWYPPNPHDTFEERFPSVLSYLQEHGIKLPSWLTPQSHCPWTSRAEFLADCQGARMIELRQLLASTVPLQTEFLIKRVEEALPKILETVTPSDGAAVRNRFNKVLRSGPAGVFALIDYVNFKGEGVSEGERYKGQGWGLLQVLQGMSDTTEPVQAFSDSAKAALAQRVRNSPPQRHEARWLPGWTRRVSEYVQ
jgi:hypothetical protein